MRALRLALVALWWRRWLSLAVLVVAIVTTGAASLGPFFARAAGESVLRDTLAAAPAQSSGVQLSATGDLGQTSAEALRGVFDNGRIPPSFSSPVGTQIVTDSLLRQGDRSGNVVAAQLVARDDVCAHLLLERGSCPSAPGDIIVSTRTAEGYGWRVGQHVRERTLMQNSANVGLSGGAPTALRLQHFTISGLYRPGDGSAPYWFGRNFFSPHPGSGDGPDTIDAVFTTARTMTQEDPTAQVTALLDLPLNQVRVHTGQLPGLRRDLATVNSAASASVGSGGGGGGGGVIVLTELPALLSAVSQDQSLLDVAVLAVTLQLAVLAWFVLYLLIAATTEARSAEVALAKLHGHSPRATLSFGLLEPVLLLVVATPLGLLLGDLVTRVLTAALLAEGTQVTLRPAAVYGAVAALAGGLVAAVLAGRRALTRPVLEQWERSGGDRAARRAGSLVDGLVIALAAAGVVQLVAGGTHQGSRSDAVALVAPAMLTLALSLLAVRLLPRLSQPALRRTRASAAVPQFLASRQLLRRPSVLRLITLLALATGLATFAVDASAIAAHNRAQRAAYDVGADRVLDVSGVTPQQLLSTVRRLDPGGRSAMAVLSRTPFDTSGDRTGTLLAVDSPRLGTVASWRTDLAGVPAATLGRELRPAVPAPITIRSGRLSISIDTTRLRATVPVTVLATVSGATGTSSALSAGQVSLGRLIAGRHTYAGMVPRCPAGCRLTRIEFAQPLASFAVISGRLVIGQVALAGHPIAARLGNAGVWQALPTADGTSQATPAGQTLGYAFVSSSGTPPGVFIRDAPDPLPAVFGAGVGGGRPPTTVQGLAGANTRARSVAVSAGVPGVGASATVVDLAYALREADGQPTGQEQVWLSAGAPADFAARLSAAGVDVSATTSTADRLRQLNRSGPALALLLFLVVAGAAAVIAAGATAVTIYLGARRRTFEIAAMRAVGVTRRQVYAAALREHLLLLATGVGVGLLGGLVGASLAMPTVPQFADGSDVPALQLTPVVLPLVALVLVIVVVVGATVLAAARLVVRAARPSRLREAAP